MNVSLSIDWHNHPLSIPAALRHRDVRPDVHQRIQDLFSQNLSPGQIHAILKQDLERDCSDKTEYAVKSCDRSLIPDYQYICRVRSAEKGAENETTFLESDDIIKDNESGEEVIAICTDFMRRVHSSCATSKDIVFLDSTGNLDRQESRVFLLITHLPHVGAVPLGIFIWTTERTETIRRGLELITQLAGNSAFCHKGYPAVVMTDDCAAEIAAVRTLWPKAQSLLCTFHVLQAYNRWISDGKHGVSHEHHQSQLDIFRNLVYSYSSEDFHSRFSLAQSLAVCEGQRRHLEALHSRKNMWSIAYRAELPYHGHDTNNLVERVIGVTKDFIMGRNKAKDRKELVCVLKKDVDGYYIRKCIEVGNMRRGEIQMISSTDREQYMLLATGMTDVLPPNWFGTLHQECYSTIASASDQVQASPDIRKDHEARVPNAVGAMQEESTPNRSRTEVEIEDGQAWDEAVNIINRSRATSRAVMSAATEFGRAIKGCKSQQSLAILLTRAGRQRYSTSSYRIPKQSASRNRGRPKRGGPDHTYNRLTAKKRKKSHKLSLV